MSVNEIKKQLDKLLIGTKSVLASLRTGGLLKVFISSNASTIVVGDIEHFASLSDAEIEVLEVSNDELGVICKKPFSVSIVGIKK